MLKLTVTALRPYMPPPVTFNEPNDFADFHVPMPLPALPNYISMTKVGRRNAPDTSDIVLDAP